MLFCFRRYVGQQGVISLVLLMSFSLVLHAEEDEPKGLQPEDYFSFVNFASPQISPDNKHIVFVKRTVNEAADGRDSQIYMITPAGDIRPFTQGDSDNSPKWTPDGKSISFTRKADKKTQIFLMPSDGGEASQLTEIDESISDYAWFPDGEKLLLTLSVKPEEEKDDETGEDDSSKEVSSDREKAKRKDPDIVVVTNAKYIQNGRGFLSKSRNHLFIYDIATAELTQVTSGEDWNARSPQISADGNSIYYHADRTGLEYEGGENSDIFKLNLKTSETSQLTDGENAQWNARLSPDKNRLVYLHKDDTYEQTELYLLDEKGVKTLLTEDFDRGIGSPLWLANDDVVLFTANDHGANRAFKLDTNSKKVTKLLNEDKTVRNLTVSPDGSFIVFTLEDSISLAELYRLELDSGEATQLTAFNQTLINDRQLSKAENVWFENDKNMRVQGFLHKPIEFDESLKYPLVLNIKGGPGGMWGHQWFHENQMYTAKGYAVVYVNYRGSSGYGIDHSKAVRLDYGGADYEDNMQFLEHVLKNNPWIDQNRLYITGGSHGGFLTNWITTKTNRFKAAVTQRSVSSWISEAGTQSFTPSQMTKEFGGNLWTNFDYYWDRSPLKYADKVETPTLIIHSDEDMITPIGQGQEWFYALKANDVETEMVVFTGENHSLSRSGKPTNLVERLDRILEWFERY